MRDLRKQGQTRPGLVESIKTGLAVPVLSDDVLFDLVLEDHRPLAQEYATYVKYTLDDKDNLPRMAKFYKLKRQKEEREAGRDFTDNDLRADYLGFVKNFLFSYAEQHGADADLLAEAEAQYPRTAVTEFAKLLGYPRFDQGAQNPLLVVANLPFRILLTTSPYTFLEEALIRAGKEPRTSVIRWRQDLRDIIDARNDESYDLVTQRPLVCHLFGLEKYSSSLVLTEDDYLDFLVDVSTSRGDDKRDSVPAQVRKALSSDLLLLGFGLSSWAFRSLHAGLIKSDDVRAEKRGVCCLQLVPSEAEKNYLDDYVQREARFDVFWGDMRQYAEELQRI